MSSLLAERAQTLAVHLHSPEGAERVLCTRRVLSHKEPEGPHGHSNGLSGRRRIQRCRGVRTRQRADGRGGPCAPSSVESEYIYLLDANGMHINGQDADELKLGYLLCALSQRNQIPPAEATAYMNAARNSKLCFVVLAHFSGDPVCRFD